VRYAPAAGYVGADAFAYTVASGGRTSASRVAVRVDAPAVADLPEPRNVVPVASAARLAEALAAARPGDHIVLADGAYSGSFVAARAGSADAPVVVRAATPRGARIRGSVRITGAHVWLWELWLEGATVGIAADGARMSRCRQTDTTGIALEVGRGRGVEIDRNELAGMRDRGISVDPPPATSTRSRGRTSTATGSTTSPGCRAPTSTRGSSSARATRTTRPSWARWSS
jgi:hypothetical protein